MEAAVRWSPHTTSDKDRFLVVDVADTTLTLNEVDSTSRKSLTYHTISSCNKLPSFAAFDWSRTNPSIVALGLVSGNAALVRLGSSSGAVSETLTTFRIKQQRKCNSIAFSSQDWLAVALDKTRSDVCLNIYDASVGSGGGGGDISHDPIRRLCAAELVSSVRFFPLNPREIVVGAQRAFIRLYDLRDGYTTVAANLQAATRNVNNIAIDAMDENYLASGGSMDDPSVTVWDKRWIAHSSGGSNSGAVFDFKPAVENRSRTSVWSIRFSGQRRGRLAMSSNTGELKVVDMVEGKTSTMQTSEYLPMNSFGGSEWRSNRYVSESRTMEPPYYNELRGRPIGERLIAFDWMQDSASDFGQGILALRPNRKVDVLRVPSLKPHADVTSRYELSAAFEDVTITEPKPHIERLQPNAPYEELNAAGLAEDFGPLQYSGELGSSADGSETLFPQCSPGDALLGRLLAPSTLQRSRCKQGYLFDCRKNMAIVSGNWQLERLWEIVNRFQEQSRNDDLILDSLDMSYVGVAGLWSERPGNSPNRRLSLGQTKPYDAIVGLVDQLSIPPFEGERTDFPEHRQLCLRVCGWKFTKETLEEECQELIDRGLYYQAIVQAVLHDNRHLAINLLRMLVRGRTVPNIGLGALLAADNINDEQREICLWMAADTKDPALKALLTFFINGDWRDVMKTNYLHLGYRVALGLRYLNDTELSGFLQAETARAVRNGDLEGILLTGLGEQAMDLFQTYLVRTNDLQTAVLATAFTNPLYVDDIRWDMWKEMYLSQLQSWRCFNEKSKFAVQHSKLARTREGRSLIEPMGKQVQLRCVHCQASLARKDGNFVHGTGDRPGTKNGTKITGPAANKGTVCLKCGRRMPRCGICHLWLGAPDPARERLLPHSEPQRASSREADDPGMLFDPRKRSQTKESEEKLAKFLVFCATCEHGFHAHHAVEWFAKHTICPVSGCECGCGMER